MAHAQYGDLKKKNYFATLSGIIPFVYFWSKYEIIAEQIIMHLPILM